MKTSVLTVLLVLCSSVSAAAPTTPGGKYRREMGRLVDAGYNERRSAALGALRRMSKGISPGETELLRQYVALDVEIGKWRKTEPIYLERWKLLEAQALNRHALILPGDRNPLDVVLRRTRALLKDLRGRLGAKQLDGQTASLTALAARASKTAVSEFDARWKLYVEACMLRRSISMRNPLLDFDKILFSTKHPGGNHICGQYYGKNQRRGGGIYVLEDAFSAKPRVGDLLAGKPVQHGRYKGKPLQDGAFMSLELDYDARTIAFAWTACQPEKGTPRGQWSRGTSWHVFTAGADGSNIRQLTDGKFNDFDPCFLPSGRIVFISERRGGFGRCHTEPYPSYTLYGMMRDGSDIIPLSYHETNEWHPSVDNDGMIVYTRWDYVDRDAVIAHHIWLTYPDGRDSRSYHGNYPTKRAWRPDAEMSTRAIPRSHKYVAVAAPHHGPSYGSMILIDQRVKDDDEMSQIKRITPEFAFPEVESQSNWGQKRPMLPEDRDRRRAYGAATPWPLDENYYLSVYDPLATSLGVYLIDAFGNRELLYRNPSAPCLSPIPLRPRKRPPVIPVRTTQAKADQKLNTKTEATISVMNVYESDSKWPEGTKITALRIIQVYPKTTPYTDKPAIGPSQSLARGIIGTAPVESDGSAFFKAPVGVPIYFQALDASGSAIQSMRSVTYVHPGENLTCQGCHEPKHEQKATKPPLALRRRPAKITPEVDGAWPLSFPRLVQPVLDRKCVACHLKTKACPLDGAASDKGQSHAYRSLFPHVNWCGGKQRTHYQPYALGGGSRSIPGQFGARGSKLMTNILPDKNHAALKLTDAERHRIVLWIDGNANFYGAYENTEAQLKGELVKPSLE